MTVTNTINILIILSTDAELEARKEQDVPSGMDKPQVNVSLFQMMFGFSL